MKMNVPRLFGLMLLFSFTFLFMSPVNANVEVFSTFDTIMQIGSDDTVEMNKSLSLRNVYDVGIVPGQVEFKLARGTDSDNQIEIEEVRAVDQYGNEIKSRVRNTEDSSVVILDIYYPLLPGFEYSFDLYYRFKYKPGGIFFKSLQIPLRESTIPIEDGKFRVVLPDSYSFTYLSEEGFNQSAKGNIATWDIKENTPRSVNFEYSYIPINLGFTRGSYAFWIIVNVLLVIFLLFEIRKAVKRVRAEYGE